MPAFRPRLHRRLRRVRALARWEPFSLQSLTLEDRTVIITSTTTITIITHTSTTTTTTMLHRTPLVQRIVHGALAHRPKNPECRCLPDSPIFRRRLPRLQSIQSP